MHFLRNQRYQDGLGMVCWPGSVSQSVDLDSLLRISSGLAKEMTNTSRWWTSFSCMVLGANGTRHGEKETFSGP